MSRGKRILACMLGASSRPRSFGFAQDRRWGQAPLLTPFPTGCLEERVRRSATAIWHDLSHPTQRAQR